MRDNVVYLLGAGFSAPLGLPVMSNFLEKAKDQHYGDRSAKYDYFPQIFALINRLASIKNVFRSNQYNIEEILSILEMAGLVDEAKLLGIEEPRELFKRFIRDVIQHHTTMITPISESGKGWETQLFGEYINYGVFVATILGLDFYWLKANRLLTDIGVRKGDRDNTYMIVTINYDEIIELYVDMINKTYSPTTSYALDMCKLHGSVATDIIPPTWNKVLGDKTEEDVFLAQWKKAYETLMNANQIRIVGYSLPETDNYVRYLLKAAMIGSKFLRRIDVICLDPAGDVRSRYDDFIDLPGEYYRFKNAKVQKYLSQMRRGCRDGEEGVELARDQARHEGFFA